MLWLLEVCCRHKLLEASGENIPTRLWIAPPTKMDEQQLMDEGIYNTTPAPASWLDMAAIVLILALQICM
jgi:aconitate hydratase 2 / 2-methylisocitrate dehydratase